MPVSVLGLRIALAGLCLTTGDAQPAYRPAPGPGEELPPFGTQDVVCDSTKGAFRIEMHPEWAPIGAAQFIEAVSDGVYDGTVIYR
jgi:hypothetical protein